MYWQVTAQTINLVLSQPISLTKPGYRTKPTQPKSGRRCWITIGFYHEHKSGLQSFRTLNQTILTKCRNKILASPERCVCAFWSCKTSSWCCRFKVAWDDCSMQGSICVWNMPSAILLCIGQEKGGRLYNTCSSLNGMCVLHNNRTCDPWCSGAL